MIRRFKYIDLAGEHTVTEGDIIKDYYPYWKMKMKAANKNHLISRENCIEDWIVVNYAFEVKEEIRSSKMSTNSIKIKIAESIEDAPKYEAPEFLAAELDECIVVPRGTVGKKATVDLLFVNTYNGQKSVAMVTGNIIEMLAGVVKGVNER